MTEKTPEQAEIEALRAQNAELLGELKTAKGEAKRLAGELQAATTERDQARTEMHRLTVGQPVQALLARIGAAPDVLQLMLDKYGFRFEMEDGQIVMRDQDGNVPQVWPRGSGGTGESRPVTFTADDIASLLSEDWHVWDQRSERAKSFATVLRAPEVTGGGARNQGGPPSSTQLQPAQPQAPAFQGGLR